MVWGLEEEEIILYQCKDHLSLLLQIEILKTTKKT